jgi:hypothetical protein
VEVNTSRSYHNINTFNVALLVGYKIKLRMLCVLKLFIFFPIFNLNLIDFPIMVEIPNTLRV